jgi:hypothetical protein
MVRARFLLIPYVRKNQLAPPGLIQGHLRRVNRRSYANCRSTKASMVDFMRMLMICIISVLHRVHSTLIGANDTFNTISTRNRSQDNVFWDGRLMVNRILQVVWYHGLYRWTMLLSLNSWFIESTMPDRLQFVIYWIDLCRVCKP